MFVLLGCGDIGGVLSVCLFIQLVETPDELVDEFDGVDPLCGESFRIGSRLTLSGDESRELFNKLESFPLDLPLLHFSCCLHLARRFLNQTF
jgi:hypothetical protein